MKNSPYAYAEKDSALTLRQGLDEYYAANPGFKGEGAFLSQPRETIVAHDVCHVVFGLGASSEEELIVEVWTFFGTILPFKKIQEAPKAEFAADLLKTFGPWRLIRRFVLTTPRMLRAFIAVLRMKKRWPHFGYEKYMDMPLSEIRREFGIRIV